MKAKIHRRGILLGLFPATTSLRAPAATVFPVAAHGTLTKAAFSAAFGVMNFRVEIKEDAVVARDKCRSNQHQPRVEPLECTGRQLSQECNVPFQGRQRSQKQSNFTGP